MTDTQPLAPTDIDIDALWVGQQLTVPQLVQRRVLARAVLAKWGAPQAPDPRQVIEMCKKALAEELAAWDIDPPLHHVLEAHDACTAWLAAAPHPVACEPLTDEQIEALPLWKRFVGLWPEARREIVRTIEHHHRITGGQHGTDTRSN